MSSVLIGLIVLCFSMVSCQERIMSLTPCSLDRDCHENSFCVGNDGTNIGTCRCKEGFLIFRNRTFYECLEAPDTIGSNCSRNLQCSLILGPQTTCLDGTCQCMENAHFVPRQNQCYQTSRPGELCQVDFNCLINDGGAGTIGTCSLGRCKCPILHHHNDEGRCFLSAYLGDLCTEDEACRHTFAACYDVCRCIGGYAPSVNGRDCLLAANMFGDNCSELSQCTEYLSGSICQDGACACHTGFHGIGTACWRDVIASGFCTDRRECFIAGNNRDNVDCIDNRCTCLDGFVSDRGLCMPSSAVFTAVFDIRFIFSILIILTIK